ncbi:MAG TPA: DNA polymerase III subunit gamma/tau [Phototrophicaceae bacterium]|nr:DNA polymerase III subunit gamma/tau [Phototrophicaceae bacterium]
MPEQALYLKWRPMSFEDVVGQEHITRTLRNSLKSGRIRHAYLFSGPRGTGKTTSARLLAKAINCQNPDIDKRPCNECPSCIAMNEGRFLDLIEIDAASHTGVDDVRDLRDKIAFAPGEGRYKVYIIDEVHRFSGSAFDALLKTLEEPPEHAVFVLATTEIDKVPQTIKSRCLQFEFRRFTVHETADRLQKITTSEGLQADRAALEMIARYGTGSMRDSISLLDQIVTDPDEPITLELVEKVLGTASSAAVKQLVEALIERDAAQGLKVINAAIDSGTDPRQFGEQVIEHLRAVLITQTAGADMIEASPDERALYTVQGDQFERARLVKALRAFNDAVNSFKGGWQPQLSLELALIESLSEPETVVQIVASTGAPTAASQPAQANVMPARPKQDATPAVPSALMNERWDKVLRALMRYSKTGPEVMKNFRVQRVEGSTVYLCTDNETFYKTIQPYPDKRKAIERALGDVFRVDMTVAIVLVSPQEMEAVSSGGATNAPIDTNDPLLSKGLELGAEIKRIDNA